MQITRYKKKCLPSTILTVVGAFVWVFMASDAIAWYPATYAASAHGDPISGVNRSTATCENWPDETCVTGSCARCHDTFDPNICENDPNGLMLFAPNNPTSQTDNFCLFQCHKSDGAAQQVTNYTRTLAVGTLPLPRSMMPLIQQLEIPLHPITFPIFHSLSRVTLALLLIRTHV